MLRPEGCRASAALMKLGRLFSTSSLLSRARVAGALAGFATQVVLARTLQASALGVFYSVTSLAAVVEPDRGAWLPIDRRALHVALSRAGQRWADRRLRRAGAPRRDALCRASPRSACSRLPCCGPRSAPKRGSALVAAALSIPANASLRLNGTLRHHDQALRAGLSAGHLHQAVPPARRRGPAHRLGVS